MKTPRKSSKPKATAPKKASSPNTTPQTASREANVPAKAEAPSKLASVAFKYVNPHAKEVRLAGSFNNWDPTVTPMKKTSEGQWETELQLPPGEYEYRYLVDGQWQDDPASVKTIQNPFGAFNSVIQVPSPDQS